MAIMTGSQSDRDTSRRDQGLVRAVGTWAFAATIVNGVVGGGIFSLPAAMAGTAGPWAPLALLVCALACGTVNLCAAEASGRVATSGGAYGYADAAFGPVAAFVTGMLVWLSSVLACGGIAAALVDGMAHSLPVLGDPVWRGGDAHPRHRRPRPRQHSRRRSCGAFRNRAHGHQAHPLFALVFVGGGWLLVHGGASIADQPAPAALGQAFILALFAFSGMETPLSASGETANPSRTIPRALLIATVFTALLYVAIQLVVQGLLGPELPGSATPLADAMGKVALGLAGAAVRRLAVALRLDRLGHLRRAARALRLRPRRHAARLARRRRIRAPRAAYRHPAAQRDRHSVGHNRHL